MVEASVLCVVVQANQAIIHVKYVTVLASVQDAKEEKKEVVLFLKEAEIKIAHGVKTMGF